MRYKRIVAKFGTNLLTAGTDSLDKDMMSGLVAQVSKLHREGHEILIVTSGAVAAGKKKLNRDRDSKAIPMKQVLSSMGQSRLMYMYEQLFDQHGINVAQALLTRADLISRAGYLNARNTLLGLIDLGVICIINENDVVATDELAGARFGDNDNLSAMVATLVDADLLILLSDIDGLYTADPHHNPDAILISRVEKIDSKIQRLAGGSASKAGTGGMTTKIQAARVATSCGTSVVIANGFKDGNLYRIARGEDVGTVFTASCDDLDSRQRWIISGLASKGSLTIDAGAVKALVEQNKSLLAAGILDLEGKFQRGDIVDINDKDGNKLGCGISNYSAKEIAVIKGAHSSDINNLLGYDYGSEVVHRNNLGLI
jgi:glutamate 5-kinase